MSRRQWSDDVSLNDRFRLLAALQLFEKLSPRSVAIGQKPTFVKGGHLLSQTIEKKRLTLERRRRRNLAGAAQVSVGKFPISFDDVQLLYTCSGAIY